MKRSPPPPSSNRVTLIIAIPQNLLGFASFLYMANKFPAALNVLVASEAIRDPSPPSPRNGDSQFLNPSLPPMSCLIRGAGLFMKEKMTLATIL